MNHHPCSNVFFHDQAGRVFLHDGGSKAVTILGNRLMNSLQARLSQYLLKVDVLGKSGFSDKSIWPLD